MSFTDVVTVYSKVLYDHDALLVRVEGKYLYVECKLNMGAFAIKIEDSLYGLGVKVVSRRCEVGFGCFGSPHGPA